MSEQTKIEWATHTFNPWWGCTKVAAGCSHCYADAFSKRTGRAKWGPDGTRVKTSEANWKLPAKWNKQAQCNCGAAGAGERTCKWCEDGCQRPRVFCASMADVFEDWQGEIRDHKGYVLHRCRAGHTLSLDAVYAHGAECVTGCNRAAHPLSMADVRADLFALIDATPNLDWLLLTKRPENIGRMWLQTPCDTCDEVSCAPHKTGVLDRLYRHNVWLGTSVAERRDLATAACLLDYADLAANLFLSIEPLIEDIGTLNLTGVDWVIVGGESGPGARQCGVGWIRSIVEQCQAADVPCFVKQLGATIHSTDAIDPIDQFPGNLLFKQGPDRDTAVVSLRDKKGGDPSEWPDDLRVRQFPNVSGEFVYGDAR